ncbi:cupin domain-containing protein [Haladaptatus pallidirubidus]|uniref:cupin domain-containing protein n=1 Tax=Haladaptatus pallidirubidus TaxID=1008152 RepID=UPI0034A2EED8
MAGNLATTVFTNELPLRRGETFAVPRGIEHVHLSDERHPVVIFAILVILPGVDQLVAHCRTELLPTVRVVGRLCERNCDPVRCRVVFRIILIFCSR